MNNTKQLTLPNLRFNLRNARPTDKPTLIYQVLQYHNGDKRINIRQSLCVKVKPEQWDRKQYKAIISPKFSALENYNNNIANNKIKEAKERYEHFLSYICLNQSNVEINLEKQIRDQFMVKKKNDTNTFTSSDLYNCIKSDMKESSKRIYRTVIKTALEYIDEKKIEKKWDVICKKKFFLDWREWIIEKKDYSIARVNKFTDTLHTLLKKPLNEDKISNTEWANAKIENLADKTPKDNTPFLYESEVVKLINLKVEDDSKNKVRDLFVLSCLTGQRFSDIEKVKDIQYIHGVPTINFITKKAGTIVRCKLFFQKAVDIINKREDDLKPFSPTYMTKVIQELCKMAGIDRDWNRVTQVAGKGGITTEKKKLYELITFHTARHTFDSIMKIRGIAKDIISEYSGHTPDMVDSYTKSVKAVDYDIFHNSKEEERLEIINTTQAKDAGSSSRAKIVTHLDPFLKIQFSPMDYKLLKDDRLKKKKEQLKKLMREIEDEEEDS